MTTVDPRPDTATESDGELGKPDLIVVHQITVLGPANKGWRTTVRIQDGWQGATISHWSRGGHSVPHGITKAAEDAVVALEEAVGYLELF